MASTNFAKATTASVTAMGVHFDDAERQTRTHSNKHIDPSKSKDNYWIGCKDWQELVHHMKDWTAICDGINPPKRRMKDRVTAVMLETPCPAIIQQAGRSREFFEMVYQYECERFGRDNVHGMTVHMDEIHDYMDKDDLGRAVTKTSLEHCHTVVTPYARWKDKAGHDCEGINGKHFMTRQMLREFHKGLNEQCLKQFGVEMLTHGNPRQKTVPILKRESEALEQRVRVGQMLKTIKHYKDVEGKIERKQDELVEAQKQVDAAQERVDEITGELDRLHGQRSDLEHEIGQMRRQAASIEVRIKSDEEQLRQLQDRQADMVVQGMEQQRQLDEVQERIQDEEYKLAVVKSEIDDVVSNPDYVDALAIKQGLHIASALKEHDPATYRQMEAIAQQELYEPARVRNDDYER